MWTNFPEDCTQFVSYCLHVSTPIVVKNCGQNLATRQWPSDKVRQSAGALAM
jgi:hypothetical protein